MLRTFILESIIDPELKVAAAPTMLSLTVSIGDIGVPEGLVDTFSTVAKGRGAKSVVSEPFSSWDIVVDDLESVSVSDSARAFVNLLLLFAARMEGAPSRNA